MSRRSLASLLLAGTTVLLFAGCTVGDPAASKPATVAVPPPVAPAALIAEGDRLAASGDLYAAIESYMAARRAAPLDSDAAARLGLTLAEQGRHAEALPHLQDAHRARADDVAITRVLVNALLALERPAQALAQLEPALAQHPEDARLWNARGIAADMMGDSEAAAAAYRSGLAAAPDNHSLKVNFALSRFASGDNEGAAKAAAAAGLSMPEVQARANRLAAYRARSSGTATASLGPVPEAPPMIALAMPPVKVQELAPVAAAAPVEAPKPAAVTTVELPATEAQAAPQAPAIPPEAVSSAPQEAPAVLTAPAPVAEPAPRPQEPAPAPVSTTAPAPAGDSAVPSSTEATAAWAHRGRPQVQLAAYARASLAESQWAKMKAEHAELLDGLEPIIQKAELGEKGVVYRLRVAVSDSGTGAALCEKLRGAGLDCVPVPAL
jgi:Flp pilus assembly protein TadD